MLIDVGPVQVIGVAERPRVRFGESQKETKGGPGTRFLLLDEKPGFELSFWCGTCQLLFKRLPISANQRQSLPGLERKLTKGLDRIDESVIEAFGALLPRGEYLPMLTQIHPRLIQPGHTGDYFSEEQTTTWGLASFWQVPEHPQTPYYRTWETKVGADQHLFEFVVPMVPPSWNDHAAVSQYVDLLTDTDAPTAVAVSILDVCSPAMLNAPADDYYMHWGLIHFLLDGHHKIQAAAESGRSIRLLSLVSTADGLSTADQLQRLPDLRRRTVQRRN